MLRANLSPILIEGMEPGGQLTTTTDVENFPGYPDGVNGTEMMMQIRDQAGRFGAELKEGVVTLKWMSLSVPSQRSLMMVPIR